jgi:hypothetical protein
LAKVLLEEYSVISRFGGSHSLIERKRLPPDLLEKTGDKFAAIRRIKIIPVVSAITGKRIQEVFSPWRQARYAGWYYRPKLSKVTTENKRGYIPSSSEIAFITNVRSLSDYTKTLSELIRAIDSTENTIVKP